MPYRKTEGRGARRQGERPERGRKWHKNLQRSESPSEPCASGSNVWRPQIRAQYNYAKNDTIISSGSRKGKTGYRKRSSNTDSPRELSVAQQDGIGNFLSEPQKKKRHSADTVSSDHIEIPGFYYDKERKKYFKILPGHSNVNVVTRETLAKKKAEQKRVSDVGKLHKKCTPGPDSPQKNRCSRFGAKSSNIVYLTLRMAQGDLKRTNFSSLVLNLRISALKPVKQMRIFENPFGRYEKLEHMLTMDACPDHVNILGLWSVKDNLVHRIQRLQVEVPSCKSTRDDSDRTYLDVVPCGNIVLQSLNKITHVCWAPLKTDLNRKYILYTTMCYTGYSSSQARIRNLEHSTQQDFTSTDFSLGNKATWTCAWNVHKQQFSVGTEKSALLLHVETRKLWELFTNNSDTLAQTFTASTGQSLISGTRKGEILTHDLRSISTYPVQVMHQRSPISAIKQLNDEIYLVASDFSGKINLWDMRMRQVVREFKGHVNKYTRLPIHLDETEQILYGVGEDCYTRFWCLKTGELLHSLPPPYPASRDSIPAVLYSQRWGRRWGTTGLLMGIQDELHLYDSKDAALI